MRIYQTESAVYLAGGLIYFIWIMKSNHISSLAYMWSGFFGLFSIISLERFLRLRIHMHKLNLPEKIATVSPLLGERYLLGFLPGASLHLLLFSPDGVLAGMIKDKKESMLLWILPLPLLLFLPKKYVLLNNQGETIAEFRQKYGINGEIEIMNATGDLVGRYKQGSKGKSQVTNSFGIRQYEGTIKHSSAFEIKKIYTNAHIADYDCGWMPLTYSQTFLNPNTPVLTFKSYTTEEEKLIAYCFCIDYLQLQDH